MRQRGTLCRRQFLDFHLRCRRQASEPRLRLRRSSKCRGHDGDSQRRNTLLDHQFSLPNDENSTPQCRKSHRWGQHLGAQIGRVLESRTERKGGDGISRMGARAAKPTPRRNRHYPRRAAPTKGYPTMAQAAQADQPVQVTQADGAFLSDVKTLRERARKSLETGAVTTTYQGDVKKTIEILQSVLATELVCVLRYTFHAIAATGISSEGVKDEFSTHAEEEQQHMMAGRRAHQSARRQAQLQSRRAAVALRLAICRGQKSRRYDQGESDRRAHRRRPLPRADPLFRRQGSRRRG